MKGLPDYHVHTYRCGHAGGESRDFVRRAVERGLSEIGLTDHIPLYFLPVAERDPKLAHRELRRVQDKRLNLLAVDERRLRLDLHVRAAAQVE